MAIELSTKLRNDLLNGRAFREIFADGQIKIYSGSAPTSADAAATGTLLVTITKSAGTVSADEVSTRQEGKITITTMTTAQLCKITLNGHNYEAAAGSDTEATAAANIAASFNRQCAAAGEPVIFGACGTVDIYVISRVPGVAFTLADNSSEGTVTVTQAVVANAQADTIRWGTPSAGVIAKESETWSGTAVATGTAGYFRLINSSDDGSLDSGYLYPRLQGNVGTSGQEMTLSSTSITSGASQTIDSATITMPDD
jgi:hypothetical protein